MQSIKSILLVGQSKWQQIKLISIDFFYRYIYISPIPSRSILFMAILLFFIFICFVKEKEIKLKQHMYEIEKWAKEIWNLKT